MVNETESGKPTVALDIDEVLCGFLPALIRYHNDTFGSSLVLSDFNSYKFCETWGGSNEEAVEKVHQFFETKYFKEAMYPLTGALEVLKEQSRQFNFVCVTSRQHCIAQETVDWVHRHFPGLVSDFHFGNHWSKEAPHPDIKHPNKQSKSEMCIKANAVALIDDSLHYAQDCHNHTQLQDRNFKVALFGQYGWNKGVRM
mmetsp:Transcript_14080/g.17453  ORF Transcript_14080/g.17453 Transcript_14080/m.17453 type:complete len:199 (+) Transcript_14080:516-1112(+)